MKSLNQFIEQSSNSLSLDKYIMENIELGKLLEFKNVTNAIYLNGNSGNPAEFKHNYKLLKEFVSNLKASEWRSQLSTKKNWVMLSEDNQKRWSGEWYIIGMPNSDDKKYPKIYKLELDNGKVRATVGKKFITELSQQYGNAKGQNEIIPCKIYYV